MPFGLTNAPVAFQQFMNNILSDLLDVCVVIYLDDILIYSNNMSEHHQHVKEVLKRLRKAGLYAKAEKCEFHSESVEYLGYILSPSGLTMSDDKVKIIQDWPEPKKVKDIQSFLGFVNFYCWFIFNYLKIVILLTCLTWKNILTLPVIMLLTLSRRYLHLLPFLLIGFPMHNLLWKLILWTMLLLQSSSLLMKIMKFIQLLFTSILSLWWS